MRIPKALSAPKLADFLNGEPSDAGVRISDFRQRLPGDGTPVSQDTSAYLSYDEKNLYVVFVCKDLGGNVRAHMAKREDIDLDDTVSVYLDTFRDRRRAYVFSTNPLGIQRDGIITEGQQQPDYNFDMQWHSQGQITQNGFVVSIAIPFEGLRFRSDATQTWGIALGRSITRTGEEAYWPYITDRIEGFVQQMAQLEGVEQVSPLRNLELIPYGTFTRSRLLDPAVPGYRTIDKGRGGLDSKVVINKAFTLDLTLNPDFSEVESDDPQVLVNQRFEVFFPEKRPFFIENAGFFATPENLFYSRRIGDPEFGGRLTGKVGGWGLGALISDDRAPGEQLAPSDPGFGKRALIGAVRVQREIGKQSTIGILATTRDFGSSFNRVFALDGRFKLSPNWVFAGQAIRSLDRELDGTHLDGAAYVASVSRTSRHFTYISSFLDRSPSFRAPLGFIERVDLRQANNYGSYFWRRENSRILAYGFEGNASADWDHKGKLQDWSGSLDFAVFLRGPSQFQVSRTEYYELFQLQHLREHSTGVSFSTNPRHWVGISGSYSQGAGADYSPPTGILPFVGNSSGASFGFTFRPLQRLRVDETYLYTHLAARANSAAGTQSAATVFNNHITRTKLNYQFTRELSLRLIVDYNSVLPNALLATQQRTKRLTGDVLFTYLLSPGTAFYVGYTDQYANLALQPGSPSLIPTNSPTTSTGRQFFVKVSYLFRR